LAKIVVDLHLQLFAETVDQLAVAAAMQCRRGRTGVGFGVVVHGGLT
jgi:hypothetical protein